MQTFKNGPLFKIFSLIIIGIFIIFFLHDFSFQTFLNDPLDYINSETIIPIFVLPILFFIFFFCFDYEISFDDSHLIYKHGILKENDEIIFSQIVKIQHHIYRNARSKGEEYLFFIKDPLAVDPVPMSLPFPCYSNTQIYKNMLRTIILANPEIQLTRLDSSHFGKLKEESMDLTEFI